MTKSAILISAQLNIAALFVIVHGPKSNHRVAMSYSTVKQYGRLS